MEGLNAMATEERAARIKELWATLEEEAGGRSADHITPLAGFV